MKINKEKLKSYLVKYLALFAILGLATVLILMLRGHFTETNATNRYVNIADALTIPAVLMCAVGALLVLGSKGSFDMLSYGLRGIVNAFLPMARSNQETYYDYKQRKSEKKRGNFWPLVISGAIYFIPALIMNIFFPA